METWTSYALSDFLMFSAASYFRRYELANAELWPGQPLLIAVAAWLWWSMRRPGPRSGLQVALLLAAVWAFVAGWFLYRHYAQINLAAGWFALAFVLQALLLLAFGAARRYRRRVFERRPVRAWHPGMLLFVYAVLVHPLVGMLAGRNWIGMEVFGVAPDATALATLGILLTGYRPATWPLLVIPLAWCAVSALTYLTMGHAHGIAPLVAAITALAATVVLHHPGRAAARISGTVQQRDRRV
jgi:hypothetical protein